MQSGVGETWSFARWIVMFVLCRDDQLDGRLLLWPSGRLVMSGVVKHSAPIPLTNKLLGTSASLTKELRQTLTFPRCAAFADSSEWRLKHVVRLNHLNLRSKTCFPLP